jgi:ketosteroid isomerase-like protein
MAESNVELVRQLWNAFERGGIDAVLEIADADVEWVEGGRVARWASFPRREQALRAAGGSSADT